MYRPNRELLAIKQHIAASAVVSGRANDSGVEVQKSVNTKGLSVEDEANTELPFLRGLVIFFFVGLFWRWRVVYLRNKNKSNNIHPKDDLEYLRIRKDVNENKEDKKGKLPYEEYINEIQYLDRKKLLEAKRGNENGDDHYQKWFIWRRITFRLRDWMKVILPINNKDPHEEVAIRVYERLRLRNAQLRELEEQAHGYIVNKDMKAASEKLDNKGFLSSILMPLSDFITKISSDKKHISDSKPATSVGARAYHLASTDLFVEKAMTYLEDRAETYKKSGHRNIRVGQFIYGAGAFLALLILANFQIIRNEGNPYFGFIDPFLISHIEDSKEKNNLTEKITTTTELNRKITTLEKYENHTTDGFSSFAKSFSALGMIVLLGVSFTRYGKVMLDQAERLLERRHALRQGRLFVHLNDGKLDINEMEKAFNWNVAGANSFSHLPTESQAPWGSVIKEIGHKVPELIQSAIEAISGKRK